MVLRHRKPTNVQETVQNVVQELDAFVKVEEHYVEQSLLGAVGMICKLFVSLLREKLISPFKIHTKIILFLSLFLFFSLYCHLDSSHIIDIH